MPKESAAIPYPVIFFDGACVVCNRFVRRIMRADKGDVFSFDSLQGETAKAVLDQLPADPKEWTMIYVDSRGRFEQSDAVIEIYRRLGGFWSLFCVLKIVPRVIRNWAYRFFARHRYRWFGQLETCSVPSPEDRKRFLP